MLSTKEQRFKRHWEDQRRGGKWVYIIPFTIGWSLIVFFTPLVISLVIDVYGFFRLYEFRLWEAIVFALIIGFFISNYYWTRNENRWKALIEKETKPDTSVY